MLNGEPQRLKDLVGQWAAGDFNTIPPIVLLSSDGISGAMGAYAVSTNTIYLNADWLAAANREQVFVVLTEELGHHLDGLLNMVDTPGDEGEKLAYNLLERNNCKTPSGTPSFSSPDLILIKSDSDWITAEASAISSGEIKTNGDAVLKESFIDLVSRDNGFGSAWRKTPVDLSKDWSTSFLVEATSGSGTSDGFTFTVNGDTNGINALGDGGQNLGFFGYDTKRGISNSYAVLFDMYTTTSASLLGFSASNTSAIPQGSIQLPISLSSNTYKIEISYKAASSLLNVNISGNAYHQTVNLASLVGRGAYLGLTAANGGGTMDIRVKEWETNATTYPTPIIRGDSLYKAVIGPKWEQAELNAFDLGGHLVKIDSASENAWISGKSWTADGSTAVYIGCNDKYQEGAWVWADGTPVAFSYWRSDSPSNGKGLSQTPNENYGQIVFAPDWLSPNGYYWNDISNIYQPDVFNTLNGIAEIPLTSSITFSPTAKEGQALTTTINLFAGTQATGNLAEGAQVWWKVTGITADDLESGALTGSGTIVNGQLVLSHKLKVDTAVENESFQVSAFSDAAMTSEYQIGTIVSTSIQDVSTLDTTPPTIVNIAIKDSTVVFRFSEAVTAAQTPMTAFKVETLDAFGNIVLRTVSTVTLDQNDYTQVILTISGPAPTSDLNVRVAYADATTANDSTGVIQDIAGNDLASFLSSFADTFITADSAVLASQYTALSLTGASNISGIGNARNNIIIGNTGGNTLIGDIGADQISGSGGPDTLIGGEGNDTLRGEAGGDNIDGGVGHDWIGSGLGSDFVNGGDGDDTITGSEGADSIDGGEGNDKIGGGSGNDSINGGEGNDTINGGGGLDRLTGGLGADDFFFDVKPSALLDVTVDRVTDFKAFESDRILLSQSSYGLASTAVSLTTISNSSQLGSALASSSAFVYDSSNGYLYWNQDGTTLGAGTGGVVAVLESQGGIFPSLSASSLGARRTLSRGQAAATERNG